MFDTLLLAAGAGTRMGILSNEVAKPALKVGNETLIGRLSRQVSRLEGLCSLYINCSHRAESIVQALQEQELPVDPIFLWEKEIMGTAWTLTKVAERSTKDLLVIHGDLFLQYSGLSNFVSKAREQSTVSTIAIHQRELWKARSVVDFNPYSKIVNSIIPRSLAHNESNQDSQSQSIWSNSGIYYFCSNNLKTFKSENLRNSLIELAILPLIINNQNLRALTYTDVRYSIETPDDLNFVGNQGFRGVD
jgi:NDP-sugar pyrophosphorylase family protein